MVFLFAFLGIVIVFPLTIAVVRTMLLRTRSEKPKKDAPCSLSSEEQYEVGRHLAEAVSFETISHLSDTPFYQLRVYLEKTYPKVFSILEIIDTQEPNNLVLCWQGEDEEALPVLLTAHQDVVPADDAPSWTYPPFNGHIADGFVWGRGSFDAKGQMIAILEAVERLVSTGFQPKRTWYLAFGCDEEVRESRGARAIVSYFSSRGIRFAFVLDEGGVVAKGFVPKVSAPIAVIGTVEKGNCNIRLSCEKEGGHSSSPDNPTALGIIGKAIWNIESKRPPAHFEPTVRTLLQTLGRHAQWPLSLILLNFWLFKPLITAIFGSSATMNALIRTTYAPTVAVGSSAVNVIANTASAMVNVRTLPSMSTDEAVSWLRRAIGDRRVEISVDSDSVRSRPSRLDCPEFQALTAAINLVFPQAVPTPYIMIGASDALYYEAISEQVYRFTPASMDTGELKRMHSRDERFSLENLGQAVTFYTTLITQDTP